MADPSEYRTKTGRVLTDADFEALADEAEAGYDVHKILANRQRVALSLIHASIWELKDTIEPGPPDEDGEATWKLKGKAKGRRERWDRAAYWLLRAAWELKGKPPVESL